MAASYEDGVVSWHHTAGEKPAELPFIMGELAQNAAANGDTVTLFIPGWGETEDSAAEAVRVWEDEFGRPAAASWISYCILPPTESNLLKIAIDVPQALANFVGEGRPVNLMTHSLGGLAVMAAADAPEMFGAVCADSPHAASCGHWGSLPGIGSLNIFRPAAAAKRLIVDTGIQLRGHRKDEKLQRVVGQARSDINGLGLGAWAAAAFAFSDPVVQRASQGFVTLAEGGHDVLILTGQQDKVVRTGEVRQTLAATALEAGLPASYFDDKMIEIPGMPHFPWCLDARGKLRYFDERLGAAVPPVQTGRLRSRGNR